MELISSVLELQTVQIQLLRLLPTAVLKGLHLLSGLVHGPVDQRVGTQLHQFVEVEFFLVATAIAL